MLCARPTAVRRTAAVLLVVVATLAGCLNAQQQSVLDALNADRRAHGRTALPASVEQAQAKAQAWAEHLSRQGSLSHSSLTAGMSGVCYRGLAENVAYSTSGIAGAQAQLMGSSGHRTNILNTRWDAVGVGYARAGNRHYVVQFFVDLC